MMWDLRGAAAGVLLGGTCGCSAPPAAPDSSLDPPPIAFAEMPRVRIVSEDPPDRALGEFAAGIAFEDGSAAWLIARRLSGLPAASYEVVAHSLTDTDVEPSISTTGVLVGACPLGGATEDIVLVLEHAEPPVAHEVWAFVTEQRRFVPLFELAGRGGFLLDPDQQGHCRTMGDGEAVLVRSTRSDPGGILPGVEMATFWITPDWIRERASVGACESRDCLPMLTDHGSPLVQLPALAAIANSGELWRIVWDDWTKELARCRIDDQLECTREPVMSLGEGLAGMFHVSRLGPNVLVTQVPPAEGQVSYRILDLEGVELAAGAVPTTGRQRYAISDGQFILGDGGAGYVAVRLSWNGSSVGVERRALPNGVLGLVSFHDGMAVVADGSAPDRVGVYDMR